MALVISGLDFVFKGGTSLILLFSSPGRFSIDVDIVTPAARQTIERILESICHENPFCAFKLSEQRSYKAGVPKAHYSLSYRSDLTGKEDYILLDILLGAHSYPSLLEKPILAEWILTNNKHISVKIPTVESITGDKLTAFAPNTTGIPYNKGKELEIIKQLYDLGRLFHEIREAQVVRAAFNATVEKEIAYRGGGYGRENVLTDIIQTGLLIAKRENNKVDPYCSNFKQIQRGLLQFKQYQMNSFFRIDEAIVSSAKSAYMAARIKSGIDDEFRVFQPGYNKRDFLILDSNYTFLNKLKAEPLFYWAQTLALSPLRPPNK